MTDLHTVIQSNCPYHATGPVADCGARNESLSCSRPLGHSGDHAACGLLTHPLFVWGRNLTGQATEGRISL